MHDNKKPCPNCGKVTAFTWTTNRPYPGHRYSKACRQATDRALNSIAAHARQRRQTGVTFCGVCYAPFRSTPVFTPHMPCGHDWNQLTWMQHGAHCTIP